MVVRQLKTVGVNLAHAIEKYIALLSIVNTSGKI